MSEYKSLVDSAEYYLSDAEGNVADAAGLPMDLSIGKLSAATAQATIAVAEATLALAEQQRIANRLAVAQIGLAGYIESYDYKMINEIRDELS